MTSSKIKGTSCKTTISSPKKSLTVVPIQGEEKIALKTPLPVSSDEENQLPTTTKTRIVGNFKKYTSIPNYENYDDENEDEEGQEMTEIVIDETEEEEEEVKVKPTKTTR